jgi:hypothetical protein
MNRWLIPFYRRNVWLTRFAVIHLVVLAILLVLMLFDARQITGVNIWLKPAKFALSISVFMLTMAWLLGELQRPVWLISVITVAVIGAMSLEQFLITLQAARETTSHFNSSTPFDSAVFSLMGFGVAANSLTAMVVLVLFLCHDSGDRPAYWMGIRTGLVIFLLGSVQGFAMIANGGHTVGGEDGGPGIPLLAWSNVAGDLRVAHFIGIHAIQVLPLSGWLIDRTRLRPGWKIIVMMLLAIGYLGFGLVVHWLALRGVAVFP